MKMPYRWYQAFSLVMYQRLVEQNRATSNIDSDGSKSGLDLAAIRNLTRQHKKE